MNRLKFLSIVLLWSYLVCCQAWAAPSFDPKIVDPLAGRTVLLLVGPAKVTQAQKAHYWDLLKRSGADTSQYKVYSTPSLPADVATRLGLAKRPLGYAALVRWGSPARFGPSAVLDPGIVTELTTDADVYVLVDQALHRGGQAALLERLPEDMRALIPHSQLSIDQNDFQANGIPHFVVAAKVRITNSGKAAATDVSVIFSVEDPTTGAWFELGRQTGVIIKAGQTVTRDLVRTTHDTPLLNDRDEIQPAKYQIRVESLEDKLVTTGDFTPLELKDQE